METGWRRLPRFFWLLFVMRIPLPLVSAPDARPDFLLLRQKKVGKEKATLGRRPAAPGSLRYSAVRAAAELALATPELGQSSPTAPGQPALLSVFQGIRQTHDSFAHLLLYCVRCAGPLGRCRATQVMAERGRGLSEGRRPEFRSPRQRRVAQGSPRRGPPTQGRLLFGDFFLAKQEKVTRRSTAETSTKSIRPKTRQPKPDANNKETNP